MDFPIFSPFLFSQHRHLCTKCRKHLWSIIYCRQSIFRRIQTSHRKKMNATLFPPTIFISFRCINLFAKGFIDQIQYKVAKSHFSQHRIEQHDNVNMKLTTKYTPNSIPLSTVRQKKLYRQNLAYFSPWKIVQEGAKGWKRGERESERKREGENEGKGEGESEGEKKRQRDRERAQ